MPRGGAMKRSPKRKYVENIYLPGVGHLTVGDDVLLSSGSELPHVATIDKCYSEQVDGKKMYRMEVRWFYRLEDILDLVTHGDMLQKQKVDWISASELCESDHADTVRSQSVISKCHVRAYSEYQALPWAEVTDFMCRLKFNPVTWELEESVKYHEEAAFRNICLCMERHNPDHLCIICEKCDALFHPKCVGLNDTDIHNLPTWSCAECIGKPYGLLAPPSLTLPGMGGKKPEASTSSSPHHFQGENCLSSSPASKLGAGVMTPSATQPTKRRCMQSESESSPTYHAGSSATYRLIQSEQNPMKVTIRITRD